MFKRENKFKRSAASVALLAGLMTPVAGMAEDVTLRSTDGTINVTGELVEVKDGSYIIRTALGELGIAQSRVVCEGAACPAFEPAVVDVAIVGSESIGKRLMPLLMAGYASVQDAEAEVKNVASGQAVATMIADGGFGDEIGSYSVSAIGDSDAFSALLSKDAALGMSSRRITVAEARALRADGSESMVGQSQERIIAVDSMLVVTNAANPVEVLTTDQLADVFSGKITNWSELGGEDLAINVQNYAEGSSNYDFFMSYLYDDSIPASLSASTLAGDDQEMSNAVFADPGAIGYVGYAFQRGAKPVTLVNECGIPMTPDAFAAKTEEYALSRRMYMYNRGNDLDPQAKGFLEFATSQEADGVILKSGFIDLGIESRPQGEGDQRRATLSEMVKSQGDSFEGQVVKEMLGLMDNSNRLSTTIRFRAGSSRVDERAREDMKRLVSYLQTVPKGSEVTFVGFTDDVGAFEANRKLSADRAQQIADEVAALGGSNLSAVKFASAGFGEIAPNACNVNERGQAINRRVEVWISTPGGV